MSLERTWRRRKKPDNPFWFCNICLRLFGDDEDLDLHFAIIHPGVDKEGPLNEDERRKVESYLESP